MVGERTAAWMVSIHAPAKGATRPKLKPDPPVTVSIHAPAKGATSRTKHDL